MDPRSYLRALTASWPLVVAAVLLGAVVAYGWSQTRPDVYRATSSVFVSTTPGEDTSQLVQGSTYVQSQLQSYTRLATTPTVLEPVVDQLGLDTTPARLAREVEAENPLGTVIVDVSATDADPVRAAAIANAVTRSLRDEATRLSPESADGSSALALSVVAVAPVPVHPTSPDRRLLTLTGAAAGGALGVAGALLRFATDARLRTRRDVEDLDLVPLLGTVRRRAAGPVLDAEPRSTGADDLRRVRARLLAGGDGEPAPRVLVLTAAPGGSDVAAVALDLALAAAERDLRVLVVDADGPGEGPSVTAGVALRTGLADVAAGRVPLEDAATGWRPGVDVLPPGAGDAGAAVLATAGVTAVLEEARSHWDVVLVAAAPALDGADPLDLAAAADAVVVVARAGRSTRPQLVRAVDALDGVRAPVLGVVLDGVRPARADRRRRTAVPAGQRRGATAGGAGRRAEDAAGGGPTALVGRSSTIRPSSVRATASRASSATAATPSAPSRGGRPSPRSRATAAARR